MASLLWQRWCADVMEVDSVGHQAKLRLEMANVFEWINGCGMLFMYSDRETWKMC